MILNEFFENHILPIMGERQDSADSYEDTYVGVINTVLIDCLDIENAIRRKNGMAELGITTYEAEYDIPYDMELMLNCIVYGVASRLYIDEAGDESNMFIFLENNYQRGKERYINALYENIGNAWGVVDYYGNE